MRREERMGLARSRPSGRLWVIPLLLALATVGCSARLWAVNRLGNALAEAGSGWAGDEDPELVRDATPFALKTIESLLAESPRHRGLLLAASSGFTQYAYAFVQQEADEVEATDPQRAEALRQRARGFYRRARDYGLRGLERDHPGLTARLSRDPNAALAEMQAADVSFLYWTAAAWGAWIGLSKDKPARLAELPVVEAVMRRALALERGFNAGALHEFFITYEGGRPEAMGGSVSKAREHFAEAAALSAGRRASPMVALAETVAVRLQDRQEFDRLLDAALALDLERAPEWRMANLIAQRRARWLKARADDLFVGGGS
ncbi:MAG: TRAP transporter TatT component family protein [candidate division NC10 bacterium]|nr:TRAP transporter TatT component family protein [candidate division NC10 bacterium]